MALTLGLVPNPPNEAWVPIQTWNMILLAETPISWFLSLDGTHQFRFWKGDIRLTRPEPPPTVGQIYGWSISNTLAQQAGLLPPTQPPPPALTAAQQSAAALGNAYVEQTTPSALPPEGH